MSVCIIGAGTAGLCAARHSIEWNLKPTVFEQSDQIGGTWVFTDAVGCDQYGIDIHTSMYQGLRTNLPKEVMGYPDFPIGDYKESYIPSEGILQFLKNYAVHHALEKYIKFRHYVIQVFPHKKKWQVLVKNLPENKVTSYIFDFIMVCNGHYNTPVHASFPGLENFKGIQLHSHDYRTADHFKDQSVLIIGGGPSGMDICNEVSKTAAKVVLSHHLPEDPKTKFKSNVCQKPDVKTFTNEGAIFTDFSFESLTTVIFCTGFKYSFPFLSTDCCIYVDENFVRPLYKHCININYSSMAFIGLPFYVCAAQMMDLQVRFVLTYFTNRKKLPTKELMMKDTDEEMSKKWKEGYKKRHAHQMGPNQIHYYNDLAETAGIDNIPPVMTKLHNESSQRFLDDLLNYRSDIFRIIDNETFIQI